MNDVSQKIKPQIHSAEITAELSSMVGNPVNAFNMFQEEPVLPKWADPECVALATFTTDQTGDVKMVALGFPLEKGYGFYICTMDNFQVFPLNPSHIAVFDNAEACAEGWIPAYMQVAARLAVRPERFAEWYQECLAMNGMDNNA